ncbi:hypothetical protein CQ018_07650 [Arthrobacter sp. MYb227]|uniref:hypothetical protein n=1 Tax=Arthrobacter sp. MYb227 TaxID=1848601 RepID=UPI000CFAB1DE|nr:hypothetical protein [Arthrobacter sp. MYb227]PQZ93542.1 hypothetical protein CQ018_07650 [Arthrobacter sp. MYb227]
MPEGLPHATIPTPDQAVAWLSQHRYDKYLAMASGDHLLALEIYAWNSELSSAILRDLAHVEVAVRNALDAELAPAFPDWATQSAPGWLNLENGTQRVRLRQQRLNNDGLKLLRSAQRDIGTSATHGMVIARLSFGFWQFLITPRARESTLWTPYLHKAFPRGTARADVAKYLDSAVSLRNRLAHLEPVASASTSVTRRLEDMNFLFKLVSPEVYEWITDNSDVTEIIDRAPVTGLIPTSSTQTP